MASETDYSRGLTNRGIPELTLKDVSVVNQYIPHLRAGTPEGDALVAGELPNGKAFTGPAWRWEQETLRLEYLAQWDRMLSTLGDIEGGPGGTLGFALDDARGAAAGAKLVDPFINNLDPRNPLNEQRVHNEPVSPFIHGAPTHLPAPPSEVEPSHVGAPTAGPQPGPRKQGAQRGIDAKKEPPPASGAHPGDQPRGLQNRLGVAPPDLRPAAQAENPAPAASLPGSAPTSLAKAKTKSAADAKVGSAAIANKGTSPSSQATSNKATSKAAKGPRRTRRARPHRQSRKRHLSRRQRCQENQQRHRRQAKSPRANLY